MNWACGRIGFVGLKDETLLLVLDNRGFQSSDDCLRVSLSPSECPGGAAYLVKDILQSSLCQGGTFNVFHSSELPCQSLSLFGGDGSLLLPSEFLQMTTISSAPCSSISPKQTYLSSLRSTCVPTMRQGTPGQWWWTSGNHFSFTFSKDAGEVTEKQTRKTSVWGYDSGRRRS